MVVQYVLAGFKALIVMYLWVYVSSCSYKRKLKKWRFFMSVYGFWGGKCGFFTFSKNPFKGWYTIIFWFLRALGYSKDQFPAKYHVPGHPLKTYGYLKKIDFLWFFTCFWSKNRFFSKIHTFSEGVREHDIWPEISPLGTLGPSEIKTW